MIWGKMNNGRMNILVLVMGLCALSLTEGNPYKLDPVGIPEDLWKKIEEVWCDDRIYPNRNVCELEGYNIQQCFGVDMKISFRRNNSPLDKYDAEKLGEKLLKIECNVSDMSIGSFISTEAKKLITTTWESVFNSSVSKENWWF